jgi:hypothetical protein
MDDKQIVDRDLYPGEMLESVPLTVATSERPIDSDAEELQPIESDDGES